MEKTNYRYKSEIHKISLTAILTGLAILLGAFAKIPIFANRYVFLMGLVILLMPLLLDFKYTMIGTTISVVITDLLNGWIAFSWISLIAYSLGIVIVYFLTNVYIFKRKINNLIIYILSVTLGSTMMIFIYVLFTWAIWGGSMAISELLTDLVQFPLISFIAICMYGFIKKVNIILLL